MSTLTVEVQAQLVKKGFSAMIIATMTEAQANQALKTKKANVSQGQGSSLMQSAADFFLSHLKEGVEPVEAVAANKKDGIEAVQAVEAVEAVDSAKVSFSDTANAIGMGQLFNYFGSFSINGAEVVPETKLDVKFLCELEDADKNCLPSEKFGKNRLLEGVKVGMASIIYKEWSSRGKRVISSHIFKDGLSSQFNKNKYGVTAEYVKEDKSVILVTRA